MLSLHHIGARGETQAFPCLPAFGSHHHCAAHFRPLQDGIE